jgi:hypothetical protein
VNGPSAEPPADLPTRAMPRTTHSIVMAGLVPATHGFVVRRKAWVPGTSPGMTTERGMKP